MVRYARQVLKKKIHPYIDDFLLASKSEMQLVKMRDELGQAINHMGVARKIGKGHWEPTKTIEHLGFVVNSKEMVDGIIPARLIKLKGITKSLLSKARRNRRLVDQSLLRHLCGVAISCSLAIPLARFYT